MFIPFLRKPKPNKIMSEKPEPILRFEKRTGLTCQKNQLYRNDWDVMSPTGIFLFTIGTLGEGIDSVTMPVADTLLPRRS